MGFYLLDKLGSSSLTLQFPNNIPGSLHSGNELGHIPGGLDLDAKGLCFWKQESAYELCRRAWSSDVCRSDRLRGGHGFRGCQIGRASCRERVLRIV